MRLMTTEEQRTKFGDAIRRERSARGWSQHALAVRLDVTDAAVTKWERGGGASQANVRAIEEAFELDPGTLGSLLGQAPPLAMPSPEDAIEADERLPAGYKRVLLAALAEIRRIANEGQ